MTSRSKVIIFSIIAILGMGIFAGCNKGMFHHSPEKKAAWIVEEISEELELNDVQQAKLETISEHVLSVRKTFKSTHDTTHNDILNLLSKPVLDQIKLNDIVTNKVTVISEKAPHAISLLADFYDSLDTDQQKKLKDTFEEHMDKHKRHHG